MDKYAELIQMVRPEYRDLAEHLFSALVLLSLFYAILRILRTSLMRGVQKDVVSYGKKLSKKVAKSTNLPKRYPCLEFGGVILVAISGYFMSLYCVGTFFLLGVLATIPENIALINRLGVLAVAAIFLIMAKYMFASSERARLEAPKLLRACRAG